ncbi:hypothetical protein C3L33_03505, partial [Rhododendron williamsianum]
MSGNKPRPVIGKLVGGWGSGERFGFADAPATSPRSPLDVKIQSPRVLKNIYDLGGVGLGIVAALEKSGDSGPDTRASKPKRVGGMELDDDLEEDYTFVTFHGPNKDYDTRVYCDNGVEIGRSGGGHDRMVIDKRSKNCGHVAAFDISPARFGDDTRACPGSDFLSSCHLCQKKLHGRDIYMYRSSAAAQASRSAAADVSNSPYANGRIFTTGILAI